MSSYKTLLENCVVSRINRQRRVLSRELNNRLAPFKITSAQLFTLAYLADADGSTAAAFGLAFDVEKSTLSRNIKKLSEAGLVAQGAPHGRRGAALSLTEKGRDVLVRAYPVWQDAQDELRSLAGYTQLEEFVRA